MVANKLTSAGGKVCFMKFASNGATCITVNAGYDE
jgi:hypothetical protein